MTIEAARSDLAACVQAATERGITLKSFVFPRNSEGHHAALREAGFRVFRGARPDVAREGPAALHRVAHLADQALGIAPPVSRPMEELPGLWRVPGSAPADGHDRHAPRRPGGVADPQGEARPRRAVEQDARVPPLDAPVQPLDRTASTCCGVLEGILRVAADARDRDQLRIAPMGAVPDLFGAKPDGVTDERTANAVGPAGQDFVPAGGSGS